MLPAGIGFDVLALMEWAAVALSLLSPETMPLTILLAGPLLLAAGTAVVVRRERRPQVGSVG